MARNQCKSVGTVDYYLDRLINFFKRVIAGDIHLPYVFHIGPGIEGFCVPIRKFDRDHTVDPLVGDRSAAFRHRDYCTTGENRVVFS